MEDGISDQHLRRPHSSYTDTSIGIGQKTARGKLFVGALDFRDNFETACDIIFEGLFGIKKCRHCARAHNLLRCNTPRHFDSRRLPLLMLFPSFPYFHFLVYSLFECNAVASRRRPFQPSWERTNERHFETVVPFSFVARATGEFLHRFDRTCTEIKSPKVPDIARLRESRV